MRSYAAAIRVDKGRCRSRHTALTREIGHIGRRRQPLDDLYAPFATLPCRYHGFFMQRASPLSYVRLFFRETMTIHAPVPLDCGT
jgi:hypothetical protein